MRGLDLSAANGAPPAESATPWWLRVQSLLFAGAFVVLTSLILVMQFFPLIKYSWRWAM